ncbi:MAG: hypothetical protein H8D23_39900 [Candidatus Brocadiales bacterium]|nr:hypothetical protein [Candidatus Brocadiales bacterium]
MEKEKYNGWTNYATWRINLEIFEGAAPMDADECKEFADDCVSNYDEYKGLAVDYARAFMSEVNWHEIAEGLVNNEE